ncbi:MAG: FAD-binding oxidoreductase [Candidatus Woesearchaeota archaeon]
MNLTWFEKLVGKENVSDEIIDKEIYSTDGSQIKGRTDKVTWVTETKQVHQIVLYARRIKKSVVPRGAGTSLVGSVIPFDSIIVDFTKMNKIESIAKDHVIVQPGVILKDLNKALKNKFFPIIPENSSVHTIGGMCGINSSSIYEKRFGKMKNWVQEVEMIDGNGRLKKYGPEVIGTEGILGLITKIKLKITDKIHEKSMDLLKFNKIEELVEKVASLKNNKEAIAIEYINPTASELMDLEKKHYLIIEYIDLEGEIKDNKEIERIWNIKKTAFAKIASQEFTIMEDPYIPIYNMAEFLYWLEEKGIPCFGPIGISVLHPCFKDRESIQELNETVKKLNGNLGAKFGIGLLKKEALNETTKQELIRLKQEFDPSKILNTGKVI